MKAGNGIVHDGNLNVDPQTRDLLTHGFQFWINLPSKNKIDAPEHLAIQAEDVPRQPLNSNKGWLKVIVGEYETLLSKIPTYSKQFIYHVHLEAGQQYLLETKDDLEYAAFLPLHSAVINDTETAKGELTVFAQDEGAIEISNPSNEAIEIILFGGAKYTEPIVFGGPFVMNSEAEIALAYQDFHSGKYGKVTFRGMEKATQ